MDRQEEADQNPQRPDEVIFFGTVSLGSVVLGSAALWEALDPLFANLFTSAASDSESMLQSMVVMKVLFYLYVCLNFTWAGAHPILAALAMHKKERGVLIAFMVSAVISVVVNSFLAFPWVFMCQTYADESSTCVGGSVVLIALYFCIAVAALCQAASLFKTYSVPEAETQVGTKIVRVESPEESRAERTRAVAAV